MSKIISPEDWKKYFERIPQEKKPFRSELIIPAKRMLQGDEYFWEVSLAEGGFLACVELKSFGWLVTDVTGGDVVGKEHVQSEVARFVSYLNEEEL